MQRFELHLHSCYSKCAVNTPEQILQEAKKKGLTGVAVTDHNTIRGALAVKELNKDPNLVVVIGEEVKTEIGEVLVYFVKKEIRPGPLREVLAEIRRQDAVCVLAHPYNFLSDYTNRIFPISGRRSLKDESLVKMFDSIEILNGRCLGAENRKAARLAKRYDICGVGGSDAHFPDEIGRITVEFSGNLRDAIKKGDIRVCGAPHLAFFNRMRSMQPTLRHLLAKH